MTWKDISIEQYIQLYNLTNGVELEDDNISQYDLFFKQIGIVKRLSTNEVENLPITALNQLKQDLQFLSKEPEQLELKTEIEIDGIKYKLKDNLANFTLGEWVDLESFNKDFINNMHRLLSVLYVREGQTSYNPIICDEVADVFLKKMDIETGLAAFFFIWLTGTHYIQSDIQDCSMFQVIQQTVNKLLKEKEQLAV